MRYVMPVVNNMKYVMPVVNNMRYVMPVVYNMVPLKSYFNFVDPISK